MRAEEDKPHFRMEVVQPVRNFKDVRSGHFNVKDDNIRSMFGNSVNRVFSALETGNTAKLTVDTELRFQSLDEHDVIIDTQDTNRCLRCIARKRLRRGCVGSATPRDDTKSRRFGVASVEYGGL
jgi:hypothetical protein